MYATKVIRSYDLPCLDRCKSFYGKAKVLEAENGSIFLKSYDTIVAAITSEGKLYRLWDGYSATTIRHFNSFCSFFGIACAGKADWYATPYAS